ncbi:MAG: aminodeoxychorismate/anthranilate synthase component II, partial [Micrococcaceae bacterium]
MKVLVIDNYDSFVYTLVGYVQELGAETKVIRNDTLPLDEVLQLVDEADAVLISPGPGNPAGAGVCIDVIKHCGETNKAMFGVCLGHQALTEAYGGKVSYADQLMHGKTSEIVHEGKDVFKGLPNGFKATRYHSLASKNDTIPDVLDVTAQTHDGTIMGIAHKTAPLSGVQFHP